MREYKRRTQLQVHQTYFSSCTLRERAKGSRGAERGESLLLAFRPSASSLRLGEFLPLPGTSRRLITPSPATEIFLYVYGSCICKISMSLRPLDSAPPPAEGIYPRRKNCPSVFTVILAWKEFLHGYRIYIINKASSMAKEFLYFPSGS